MRTPLFIALTFFAAPLLAQAQPLDASRADSVDAYVARVMKAQQIPGMAVAVVRDGRVVLARGYGFANLEHQVRVTPNTVFQSGSVGKAFTVMAVMMLVEDGLLKLDDPISRYFPDTPTSWRAITVRHLLEHTSGLPGYPEDFDFRVDRTEDELYNMIRSQPLAFALGERRGYSNLGFVLLGILIHKVTGAFYGDVLKQRIFDPLDMFAARVNSEADIVPNRAAGYRLVDGALRHQEWVAPSLNTPADGSLLLTVLDMVKWEAALNAGRLLKPESFSRMWSPLSTSDGKVQPWGFSWQIEDINGQRIVEHSGGWQGFTANFSRYPAKKLTVVVFLNLRGANPVAVTRGIQEIYQPELSIASLHPIAEVDPAMATFVRTFVQRLTERKLSADMFVSPVGDELLANADEAAAAWQAYGTLQRLDLISSELGANGTRLAHYRLSFANRQIVLIIGRNSGGKITVLDGRD